MCVNSHLTQQRRCGQARPGGDFGPPQSSLVVRFNQVDFEGLVPEIATGPLIEIWPVRSRKRLTKFDLCVGYYKERFEDGCYGMRSLE